MNAHATPAQILQRQLRRCFGSFATGVTVVTCVGSDGAPEGVTINSFTSVSLEPPLILFCLDKNANVQEAFQRTEAFTVNILATRQRKLAAQFASLRNQRWKGVSYTPGQNNCPIIADAAAWLECKKYHTYEGGDHWIYVGLVTRFHTREKTLPLVFHKGQYRHLGKRAETKS